MPARVIIDDLSQSRSDRSVFTGCGKEWMTKQELVRPFWPMTARFGCNPIPLCSPYLRKLVAIQRGIGQYERTNHVGIGESKTDSNHSAHREAYDVGLRQSQVRQKPF